MKWIPEELYQNIIKVMPIVCVDVVITYEDKVLLVKRNREPAKGLWWLPGGRLHKGEGLLDCALRKAKEECGLDCKPGPMVHYAGTVFENVHSVNFCFLLFAKSHNFILDQTSSDGHWFYNLPVLDDYVMECIRKAKDYAKN